MDTTYFVENWKHCSKVIFKCAKNYCSLFFLLVICLGALFMSHEQCTRRWSLKKKEKKKKGEDAQMWTQKRGSKLYLSNTIKYHLSITETLIITFQELPKAYDDCRILALSTRLGVCLEILLFFLKANNFHS